MTESVNLITKQVQQCLENLLTKLNVKNYRINLSPGSTKGDNFLGIIIKAKIEGEDQRNKKITYDFIIKSAPRNEVFRSLTSVHDVYNREIYIYKEVLHEFDVLQKEKNVKEPFKSYAKYYDSLMDDRNEALIMENMKEHGYELHNRHEPLNYEHALLVLREYAKLHALSFALRIHKPTSFKRLTENSQNCLLTDPAFDGFHQSFQQQGEKVLLTIDPLKEAPLYERFKEFKSRMVDYIKNILKTDLNNPYYVIRHGDCWINNFIFKYKNPTDHQKPNAVCILDWQLAHHSSPALDLGYFIFTSTDKEMRDKHYTNMIEEYYRTFSNFLKELGGDPHKQFPFQVLQEHLKKYSVLGLYMAIMCLLIMTSSNDEVPDVNSAADAEDIISQFNYDSKNVEVYNSRIRGVILDFEKLGYDF